AERAARGGAAAARAVGVARMRTEAEPTGPTVPATQARVNLVRRLLRAAPGEPLRWAVLHGEITDASGRVVESHADVVRLWTRRAALLCPVPSDVWERD